jgi:hypothetical protein
MEGRTREVATNIIVTIIKDVEVMITTEEAILKAAEVAEAATIATITREAEEAIKSAPLVN